MYYMYTKEYYPVIEKNEIMSFASGWMDLKIVICPAPESPAGPPAPAGAGL